MNTSATLTDYVSHYLAADPNIFNSGNYSRSTYGCASNDQACLDGATGSNLADTGSSLLIPMVIGGALLIASAILLVKRLIRNCKQA